MSYFGVSTRNGVGLGLGTVPSLTNTPLGYRLAPSLNLSFAGSDTLDPSITFSRTTNATLTNSAGLVANAPMNLLTFSEQFDNAVWIKQNATVTANSTVAPDGTLTADTMTAAAANGTLRNDPAKSGEITNSIYVKRKTGTGGVQILDATGTYRTITVTSEWTRVSYTATAASASLFGIRLSVSGDEIYVWGAQSENSSTATTYNPTTVKNLLGFTENFDNAAWTKSNAFVQTNLLLQSEFSNAVAGTPGTAPTSWSFQFNTGSTAVPAEGGVTLSATTGNRQVMAQVVALAANTTYTISFDVVAVSGTGTDQINAYQVNSGALTSSTAITVADGTGRKTATLVAGAAGANVTFRIGPGSAGGVTSDGSLTINKIQLVQGASAGDYKATYAAAAAVGYTDIYGQPFAQKLVENTAAATQHLINNSYATAGTSQTLSIYAKAAERTQFAIQLGTNASFFDLSAGTVISGPGNIQSIGNGWYRCSLSGTPTNANTLFYLGVGGSATYTGDGTSGIYIFGAQLADSASVDPYVYQPVAAPTSVAYYGPRFDYDPVTLAPKGLLIEEQRTNLCLYSGAVGGTGWVSTNGGAGAIPTVTLNAAVAPDGTSTASRVQLSLGGGTTTTDQSLVVQALTGTSCRGSFYVKTNDNSTKTIYARGLNAASFVVDGTWRRYDFDAGTLSGTQFGIGLRGGQGTANSNTADILVWGAQLEAGAFATSYIPTVASQVTRAADSASMIGNNFARWYTQGVGTMLASFDFSGAGSTANPSTRTAFNISDGTSSNRLQIYNISGNVGSFIAAGGASQAALDTFSPVPVDVFRTIALAYASNDAIQAVNGSLSSNDTSVIVPVVNAAYIGSEPAAGRLNGHIKRVSYYNRRLANTELQSITS